VKTYYFTAVALLIVALPIQSDAQIPRTLSYQGVLSDTSGVPKPDGAYTLTFRLYDSSVGGSVIWTETKTLQIKHGLFSTILADQTSFGVSITFEEPYWLSIQVGTEPELLPRIPLTSVAYSLGPSGFSRFQVFDNSGTFTVPPSVTKVMVEVWGGGGAGSGTSGSGNGGSGGGAGGYGKEILSVLPGAGLPVTVGTGGVGVVDGTGNPGGGSSFDVLVSASGGGGAARGVGGGVGGNSSAAFNVDGGFGTNGGSSNSPGSGGSAGGGGGSGAPGGGSAGISPGGGGSGTGIDGSAGGNGASGRIVVWW